MFKRLPFGISSAPGHFQKRMDKELSGIEGVKCRMDDILVMGKDQAEHDHRLKQVFDRLVERRLTLNVEKCSFSQSRLQYLGQILDSEGVRKDPSRVKADCGHGRTPSRWRPETVLGIGQSLYEVLPKFGREDKTLTGLT